MLRKFDFVSAVSWVKSVLPPSQPSSLLLLLLLMLLLSIDDIQFLLLLLPPYEIVYDVCVCVAKSLTMCVCVCCQIVVCQSNLWNFTNTHTHKCKMCKSKIEMKRRRNEKKNVITQITHKANQLIPQRLLYVVSSAPRLSGSTRQLTPINVVSSIINKNRDKTTNTRHANKFT